MSDNENDQKPDVRVMDLGPMGAMKPPTFVRVNGKSYRMPEGVLRVAVAQIIAAADCGLESIAQGTSDMTIEARALEGARFIYETLGCATDEEIEYAVKAEISRLGAEERGARELYANLLALSEWTDLFFGPVAFRFLCDDHKDLAIAQRALADDYAEADSVEADESADAEPSTGIPFSASYWIFNGKSQKSDGEVH